MVMRQFPRVLIFLLQLVVILFLPHRTNEVDNSAKITLQEYGKTFGSLRVHATTTTKVVTNPSVRRHRQNQGSHVVRAVQSASSSHGRSSVGCRSITPAGVSLRFSVSRSFIVIRAQYLAVFASSGKKIYATVVHSSSVAVELLDGSMTRYTTSVMTLIYEQCNFHDTFMISKAQTIRA